MNGKSSPARLAALGMLLAPARVLAHGTVLDWHVPASDSLLVLLPLAAVSVLYSAGMLRRHFASTMSAIHSARALAFFTAVLLLALALVWPLDAWSGASFAAHMGQHMVLLALAPPLLVFARPGTVCLRGLPDRMRRPLLAPRRWPGSGAWRRATNSIAVTGALHGVLLWGWHVPAAFELALRNDGVHWLEHVTLLAAGLLYWRALLRARGAGAGWALASMLSTLLHSGVLGALLTLAPRPLYASYAAMSGATQALADQQLAGLIMWVPMGAVYLLGGIGFASRFLRDEPRTREQPAPGRA